MAALRQLKEGADSGDVSAVVAALAAGADVNGGEGLDDNTALQVACASGHLSVVSALLAAGAHVNGATSKGFTPLIYAASARCGGAVLLLLEAGAHVHAASSDGSTPLHWATRYARAQAVRDLLLAGARSDLTTVEGWLPSDLVSDWCVPPGSGMWSGGWCVPLRCGECVVYALMHAHAAPHPSTRRLVEAPGVMWRGLRS